MSKKLTPMLKQYYEIKEKYPNDILFFRLGDFYEMFGDDAKIASKILNITLTARHKGSANEMPMCGIPHHAFENYVSKLTKAGYRVAVCEQVGDPSLPGIVKREVARVITPGTTFSDNVLENKKNNYLMSLILEKNIWGIALVDLTTGEFQVTEINDFNLLKTEIQRLQPAEVIVNNDLINDQRYQTFLDSLDNLNLYRLPAYEDPYKVLINHFKVKNLESFGVERLAVGIQAAGALFGYLRETQKTSLEHLLKMSRYVWEDYMVLDEATMRNLELWQNNYSGELTGSLISILDKTLTNLGGRKLRKWLSLPLLKKEKIEQRLDFVAEIKQQQTLIIDLCDELKQMLDLERLVAKIGCNRANARDLIALKNSLNLIPQLKDLLKYSKSNLGKFLYENLAQQKEVIDLIEERILDEPSAVLTEGNLIKDGFDQELDDLRKISRSGKTWIKDLQVQESARTGISSLKIKYNRIFGYYIEISKTNLDNVPEDYIRKQTLVNAERFITPELKEYEEKVLNAEGKIIQKEQQLFLELREKLIEYFADIQKQASLIAQLDVLTGFARLANANNYCQPKIKTNGDINLKNSRHPVIEKISQETYISNDLILDQTKNQFILLTGPNMSGKSSFLRQVALIVLMAQIGSFVPAESAEISVVDRIFTRVGASDNLSQGVSTFMMEMQEAANILNNATEKSLIILDELGRGTSTYDGMSIAWAIIEFLHDKIKAKTLFATHYHELTDLVEKLERAENYCVAVKEDNGRVVFLHKIIKGEVNQSYGIEVAKMAGLPESVINRSNQILEDLEVRKNIKIDHKIAEQGTLPLAIDKKAIKVKEEIDSWDLNEMTPIDVLIKLKDLKDEK